MKRKGLLRFARSGMALLPQLALCSYRWPGRVAGLAAAIAVLSWFGARQLRLDADLTALLPDHFPSVRALSRLEDRAGATGYVVVVARGASADARRSYADALGRRLEKLDSIAYVEVQRPRRWLLDHRLQIAPLSELEEFVERLEERVDWEIQRRNPLFFDLGSGEPPALEMTTDERSANGRWFLRQTASDYYEHPERGLIAVLARPRAAASDFHVAASTVAAVERVVASLQREPVARGVSAELTGRYKKQVDQKAQIQSDLRLSSACALALVLLYLGFYFRRLGAIVELGVPLIVGLVATFGIVGITFGELNILTAFIGAILLGLGIDHGIHLLSSFRHHRSDGLTTPAAIEKAFAVTGRAVTMAALTTMAGFLGLALSEFRTFRQFGIVAAVGMSCILVAYAVGLPALLRLTTSPRPPRDKVTPWSPARPRLALCATALALATLSIPVRNLGFDADFSALQDSNLPSFQLDRLVNDVIGHSQTPTLILTEGEGEERAVGQRLRDTAPKEGTESTIDMVASISDLVDAKPATRAALLERVRVAAGRIRGDWLDDDEARRRHEELLEMTQRAPVSRSNLPPEILRRLGANTASSNASATVASTVLVFPAISLSRGDLVLRYAGDLRRAAKGAPIAGEAMVLADILETVERESRSVLMAALLGVFVALWALERRLRPTLIALACAGLTLSAGLGLLVALGGQLNYLNMVVIPVLFGVAVDGAVHLVQQAERDPAGLGDSRRAIAASLLTTGLGFGSLLLADHPGLRSLGLLALLGLAANALVSLWLLPSVLLLLPKLVGVTALPAQADAATAQ